jgi:hypothetical protein
MGAWSTNKYKITPGEYGTAQTVTIQDLDVHGSVHHSIKHKKNPTRCNNVSKFYYSIFI